MVPCDAGRQSLVYLVQVRVGLEIESGTHAVDRSRSTDGIYTHIMNECMYAFMHGDGLMV